MISEILQKARRYEEKYGAFITDEEWQAYLDTLAEIGMNELLEIYQTAYNRYAANS